MKKIISIFLSLILLLSCVSLFSFAVDEELPTIYIIGQGQEISIDGKSTSKVLYPVSVPDGVIGDEAKKLALPLAGALVSNNWKEYGDGLFDAMYPFLEELACDKEGNVTNGSTIIYKSSQKSNYIYHAGDLRGNLKAWSFSYDWRLDPIELAEQLHKYVNFVKGKTGAERFNIVARCFAGDIMLAYIDKYGSEEINDLILCSVGFDGFESIGAIFAGKIDFDADAVDRFLNTYLAIEDYAEDPTFELVRSLCTCLNYIGGIEFTADILQKVINGIKDDALKRILLCSFASMPSFWTYVGDEYYEDAKAYLFGGVEEEYKVLIEKLDRYHYDILTKYADILKGAEEQGTRVYNVCKYGIPILPVLGNSKIMSDSIISSKNTSMGATCSDVDGVLSDSYLKDADPKFISPDKQIDASTCLYPEHTWFIKNTTHRNMPVWIDDIFKAILDHDGYTTVFDLEEFPQYLIAADDSKSISPLTVDNSDNSDKTKPNPLKALFTLLKNLFRILREKLFEK